MDIYCTVITCRADTELSGKIRDALSAENIRPVFITEDIAAEEDRVPQRVRALVDGCLFALVVLSDESEKFSSLRAVIKYAFSTRKMLLPYKLHPRKLGFGLQLMLGQTHWLDVSMMSDPEEGIGELRRVAAIHRRNFIEAEGKKRRGKQLRVAGALAGTLLVFALAVFLPPLLSPTEAPEPSPPEQPPATVPSKRTAPQLPAASAPTKLPGNAFSLIGRLYSLKCADLPFGDRRNVLAETLRGLERNRFSSEWADENFPRALTESGTTLVNMILNPHSGTMLTPKDWANGFAPAGNPLPTPGVLALYTGWFSPAETGTYRFIGIGDDAMLVGLDGETVLFAYWPKEGIGRAIECRSDWFPPNHCGEKGNDGATAPAMRLADRSVYRFEGSRMRLEKGKTYRVGIAIADACGGGMGGILGVVQEGKSRKDGKIPLFIIGSAADVPEFIRSAVEREGIFTLEGPEFFGRGPTTETAAPVPAEPVPAKASPPLPTLDFPLTEGVKLTLVHVPKGKNPIGGESCDAFFLGDTEVTQTQWRAVMGTNPSTFVGDDLPVESVSWNDAVAFCEKLNELFRTTKRMDWGYSPDLRFTLPTRAQWEYACRAGTTAGFLSGDGDEDLQKNAWFAGNSKGRTHEVGSKEPNAFGLHDMLGNVWEWVLDSPIEAFPGKPTPLEAFEKNITARTPEWNSPGIIAAHRRMLTEKADEHRMFCGGNWAADYDYNRPSVWGHSFPYARGKDLGFRVAMVLAPKDAPAKSSPEQPSEPETPTVPEKFSWTKFFPNGLVSGNESISKANSWEHDFSGKCVLVYRRFGRDAQGRRREMQIRGRFSREMTPQIAPVADPVDGENWKDTRNVYGFSLPWDDRGLLEKSFGNADFALLDENGALLLSGEYTMTCFSEIEAAARERLEREELAPEIIQWSRLFPYGLKHALSPEKNIAPTEVAATLHEHPVFVFRFSTLFSADYRMKYVRPENELFLELEKRNCIIIDDLAATAATMRNRRIEIESYTTDPDDGESPLEIMGEDIDYALFDASGKLLSSGKFSVGQEENDALIRALGNAD